MPTAIARDQSKEAAFEQLVDQLLDAIETGDLQRLAAMHGKEPELRFAGSDGPFHHGWTGAGDDHPNGFEAWLTRAFSSTVSRPRLSKSDFQLVRLGANSFLTTCQVQREASGEMPSTQPAAQRLSLLWRQNKGIASYAIVHAHFSARGA